VSSYGGTPRGFNLASVSTIISLDFGNAPTCGIFVVHFIINIRLVKMIITENLTAYKGKVKTHNYINRQNQSTTGKL
jgi:hypothetical protein